MEGQRTIGELAEGVMKEMERLQFSPLTILTFGQDVGRLRSSIHRRFAPFCRTL